MSPSIVTNASQQPAVTTSLCSLDDDVEELVPVCRLEAGEAHGETLDFLYYVILYVKVLHPAFV